jgi:hypothetical protein
VPYLEQLFERAGRCRLDELSDEEYARGRAEYIKAGKGAPPPGAAP